MATKKKSKKGKSKAAVTDAPKIVAAKQTVSASELLVETNYKLDDPLSKRHAKEFADAMVEAIQEAIADGKAVNLFGLLKIVPRLHTKGTREVYKEFGNPESGRVNKKYPAKVSVKASFLKKTKESLPSVQKMQKRVGG